MYFSTIECCKNYEKISNAYTEVGPKIKFQLSQPSGQECIESRTSISSKNLTTNLFSSKSFREEFLSFSFHFIF